MQKSGNQQMVLMRSESSILVFGVGVDIEKFFGKHETYILISRIHLYFQFPHSKCTIFRKKYALNISFCSI